jgi:glycosyltransferase involved in cell wall biosynthesis
MRIAYLLASSGFSGGAAVVLLQAEALGSRGHSVTVVSPESEPDWFHFARTHFERASFRESQALARADVRVATFWTTVAPALEGARVPVFHLCQGYEASFPLYADRRESIEAAYRAPTTKLTITETLAKTLSAEGFGPAITVGQAFDARPFSPGPPRDGETPAVLLVGQYEGVVKGIDVALEGLRIWRSRGGRFHLLRAAMTPPSGEERQSGLVDAYHVALAPARMPLVYREADLFIGPSRVQEGFGLPVLEALASGLPSLLSDTPTHREIAGEAAWYFRDGDPDALAAALPALLTREARAKARARGPTVAARFDPDSVAERLERAFLGAEQSRQEALGSG